MKIQGGGKLSIADDGMLKVAGIDGLRVGLPRIYQEVNGFRKNIAGRRRNPTSSLSMVTFTEREFTVVAHGYLPWQVNRLQSKGIFGDSQFSKSGGLLQ